MNKTACPLDCYDGCSVVYEDGKLKGDKDHPLTAGFLCPNLNSFLSQKRIESATFQGERIDLDRALEILATKLKKIQPATSLYYKGHGNFGVMQNITAEFFSRYGSATTRGSLCDSAGEAGIKRGRGKSLILTKEQIELSEVVVIWGRDIDTTNSHFAKIIEKKIVVVIDPIRTKIAQRADIHFQIEPHYDLKFAILLARFILMQSLEDMEFIENRSDNYDYFVDFIRTFRVKELISELSISPKMLNSIVDLISSKRTIFLVGVGVQKYLDGADILHMIDSLAGMLGLFDRDGCGVSYLGESSFGYKMMQFEFSRSEPKVNVDFSKYDLVFIQGSNPANQMPNSSKVIEGLKGSFVVYFGLYENETSALADLVIPAKSFLAKSDLRLSYGHDYLLDMPKLVDEDIGISEYDLANYLLSEFGFDMLDDNESIKKSIIDSNSYKDGGYFRSKSYDKRVYSDRFYNDDELFYFIDEVESHTIDADGYYLVTKKAKHSLNSQFNRSKYLYIAPNQGYSDRDIVLAKSSWGEYRFEVRIDDRLRDDTILIYSGTKGVNYLTPPMLSYEGDGACYQDTRVTLKRVDA